MLAAAALIFICFNLGAVIIAIWKRASRSPRP